MTLTKKLIATCVSFGLVPLLVVTALVLVAEKSLEKNVETSFASYADSFGEKIDRILYERYGDVQAFVLNPAVTDRTRWYKAGAEQNPAVGLMNEFAKLYSTYDLMLLLDTDGKVAAASTVDVKGSPIDSSSLYGQNYSSSAWFKDLQRGQFTTMRQHSAKENNLASGTLVIDHHVEPAMQLVYGPKAEAVIGFAAPLRANDKVIGYWVNFMSLVSFKEMVEQFQRSTVGGPAVAILDEAGRVMIARKPFDGGEDGITEGVVLSEQDCPPARKALSGGKGADRWESQAAQGDEEVVGYAYADGSMGFAGMGWSVLVHDHMDQAAAAILKVRSGVLWTAFISTVLILVLALLIGRSLSAPIITLAGAASRISQGDVDVDVTVRTKDEIGVLADSFRTLIEYVRDVQKAVAEVASGDLSRRLVPRSAADQLSLSTNRVAESLQALTNAIGSVAADAIEGNTAARVDAQQFTGAYGELAQRTNGMLDAMLAPVSEATTTLEQVANNDLTAAMTGQYKGDHDRLKTAVNVAVHNVREGLLQVSRGAEQVRAASGQIAAGSQTLAAGASEQAASLSESRSVLETVAGMTSRNAENAQHANGLSAAAQQSSQAGSESIEQMNSAVAKIRAAVENTAQIIRDINQIAFQTNLLALNAAVEAARAGDAGRGFAVVADEVRNLAQQAKQAAQKTEELLQDSIKQAERGEVITKDVTRSLGQIVVSVAKVGEIIGEIAAASREQSQGIDQVHKASAQMDQVTHQNAASSEELSSTAEELSAQAQELTAMVGRFRLSETSAPTATVRPTALRPASAHRPAGVPSGAALIPFEDDLQLRDF
jgi:methyl-accepting chemotaxis protein